jgi:hypothetical protein
MKFYIFVGFAVSILVVTKSTIFWDNEDAAADNHNDNDNNNNNILH